MPCTPEDNLYDNIETENFDDVEDDNAECDYNMPAEDGGDMTADNCDDKDDEGTFEESMQQDLLRKLSEHKGCRYQDIREILCKAENMPCTSPFTRGQQHLQTLNTIMHNALESVQAEIADGLQELVQRFLPTGDQADIRNFDLDNSKTVIKWSKVVDRSRK